MFLNFFKHISLCSTMLEMDHIKQRQDGVCRWSRYLNSMIKNFLYEFDDNFIILVLDT